jgi:hypothetical protein
MRPFWGRLIRHAAWTGISLAAIGYVLARAFLFTHKLYGGGAYDPENERVLWQTPLVMAAFGIALTLGMDLLIGFIRRPVQVPAQPST